MTFGARNSGVTNPRRPGSKTGARGREPSRASGDIGTKSPGDAPRPGEKSSEDSRRTGPRVELLEWPMPVPRSWES
eukprot:947978-Alexandrium_andersonii.AAC.1